MVNTTSYSHGVEEKNQHISCGVVQYVVRVVTRRKTRMNSASHVKYEIPVALVVQLVSVTFAYFRCTEFS